MIQKLLPTRLFFSGTLLATTTGLAQAPLPAMPTVALTDVAVRATPRQLVLRAPGEAKGLNDAIAWSLAPTSKLAVWHPHPDSGHTYRIRAVRVRLGSRIPASPADLLRHRRQFVEGRLALRLTAATATGAPTEANLLAAPLVLTPAASAQHDHGWVRFDVAAQHLVVPAGGIFVVAEGLTTTDDEQYVRHRTLVKPVKEGEQPEEISFKNRKANGKGTAVFIYEEVKPLAGGPSRFIPDEQFPALAHRTVEAAGCRTWRWQPTYSSHEWKSLAVQNAEYRRRNPALSKMKDFNYDLELEVEEL